MEILLLESYQVIRHALAALVGQIFEKANIHQAASLEGMYGEFSSIKFDLILFDAQLAGGDSFQSVTNLRKSQLRARILIFTAMPERIYAIHFLRAGANGFISKTASSAELCQSIVAVTDDGRYMSSNVKMELLNQLDQLSYVPDNPLVGFSAQEITIMDMLLSGLWAKQIASMLGLKESSISNYKRSLFEKLEVNSLIEFSQRVEHFKELE